MADRLISLWPFRQERPGPRFLVLRTKWRASAWPSDLAALVRPSPRAPLIKGRTALGNTLQRRSRVSPGSIFFSLGLHALLIFYLAQSHWNDWKGSAVQQSESLQDQVIYYYPPPKRQVITLPDFKSKGPGGAPGQGSHLQVQPLRGATPKRSTMTVISNPMRPDNAKQTVYQPASPPNVRIQQDLALPDVVLAAEDEPERPRIAITPLAPRPRNTQEFKADQADDKSVDNLSPAVPVSLTRLESDPALGVHPPIPAMTIGHMNPSGRPPNGLPGTAQSGGNDASTLVVLNTLPQGANTGIAIPVGNRYGSFSYSPYEGEAGTPGGSRGGSKAAGTGGTGNGGDTSAGVGPGNSGGGGNKSGGSSWATISGASGRATSITGTVGKLEARPLLPAGIIPVISMPKLRTNHFVISTGPMGGGGLAAYGVLRGAKIYTMFVQAQGKPWVIEYCLQEGSDSNPSSQVNSNVIQVSGGLVPPEVVEQFDFVRTAVPHEKANDLIILHGVIEADGKLSNLSIHNGVLPEMDRLALEAFRRWKFKPAISNRAPTAVEILVGIPANVVAN